MTEKDPSSEILDEQPELESTDTVETKAELGPEQAKAEEAKQAEKLETAKAEVNEQATETKEQSKLLNSVEKDQQQTDEDYSMRTTGPDLAKATLRKEMAHIRKKLGSVDKLGSRLIHQPVIKSVSDISGKTVTRPSGLLGGGITAFLGTGSYLYLTKHYGLKYNYLLFFLLLVGGFILGVVIEALIRLFKKSKVL